MPSRIAPKIDRHVIVTMSKDNADSFENTIDYLKPVPNDLRVAVGLPFTCARTAPNSN